MRDFEAVAAKAFWNEKERCFMIENKDYKQK